VPNEFHERLYALIRQIPAGKVSTYGDLAQFCGMPRGARQVGWALHAAPEDLPWWRVVNRLGIPAHDNADLQAKLLRADGVKVGPGTAFIVDAYRWEGPPE
jgi:methylated-DNA-protein-cysteine methyltransferase-like protein